GIKLWSLQDTDAEPRLLEGHRGVVNRLVFTPDSTTLVSCSRDKTTRIWDVASGRERFVLEGHRAPVNGLAVSPDGTLVATASEDQSVKIWSLAEGKTLHRIVAQDTMRAMHTVLFTPDGRGIIANGSQGGLQVYTP
ncbi:MAG: hypothetical protein VB877_05340, partial [Pirellulaceae bacterium]